MKKAKDFIWKIRYFIIAIFICSTLSIGGTYAWVNIEILGTKTNRITSGSLEIVIDESACNNMTFNEAYPISDEVGLTQVACTFSVENTGTLNTVYSVFLDDLDLVEGEERMPDSAMKYSLSKNSGDNKIGLLNSIIVDNNKLLDSDKIAVGEKNTYEFRFWIDENAGNDATNKVFYTKLRVVADVDTSKPVIPTVGEYYTYGINYVGANVVGRVELSKAFKTAVNSNSSFTDSKGNVWNAGDPLPNPGITYVDSEGNEQLVTDMSGMFSYSAATSLDVSGFDTSNVTNMSGMFSYSATTIIDVSGFDTSNVTDMSRMFSHSAVTSLDVSGLDTSNVTNMKSMFNFSVATSLDVSGFDTSNVTDMSGMFKESAVTSIDVSGFDTSNVTNMVLMFSSSAATSLDVSGFNTSNVTDMGGMFWNSAATELDVSGFDTSNVTGMSTMFHESAATSLDVSRFDTSNVTDMSHMFSYSPATSLDVSGFDTSNVTNMRWMFTLSDATSLDVSGFDTSNVTTMSHMFYGSAATSLDVSGFDTSNVTDMSHMFYSSAANPIYVKDQVMLDRFVNEGFADSNRLQIK